MKMSIGIVAAVLLVAGIALTDAAFAGPAADGTTCSFSAPKAASPAALLRWYIEGASVAAPGS